MLTKAVPRDSVMGPLLFNISRTICWSSMKMYNYVDLNSLDSSSENLVDILYNLRYDACNSIGWFTKWYASQPREVVSFYAFFLLRLQNSHSHLVLMYDVPVWFSTCPLECIYKTSYPSLECACGGRVERPQMVYANDNTSLIDQVKFRRNRYPWAHPLWFVEWSSTWWPMHLWPGHTK